MSQNVFAYVHRELSELFFQTSQWNRVEIITFWRIKRWTDHTDIITNPPLAFVADLLEFGEQLLTLEPPLSENDYSFSLGTEEGLSDLFDFKF